jgi:hypothetical protein
MNATGEDPGSRLRAWANVNFRAGSAGNAEVGEWALKTDLDV